MRNQESAGYRHQHFRAHASDGTVCVWGAEERQPATPVRADVSRVQRDLRIRWNGRSGRDFQAERRAQGACMLNCKLSTRHSPSVQERVWWAGPASGVQPVTCAVASRKGLGPSPARPTPAGRPQHFQLLRGRRERERTGTLIRAIILVRNWQSQPMTGWLPFFFFFTFGPSPKPFPSDEQRMCFSRLFHRETR